MAATLLLDQTRWGLCLDANGNIACATEPYSQLQDAASAIRTFKGECWYDTTLGIPYFENVLGKPLNGPFLAAKAESAAKTVPGVVAAKVTLTGLAGRALTGQVAITTSAGTVGMGI